MIDRSDLDFIVATTNVIITLPVKDSGISRKKTSISLLIYVTFSTKTVPFGTSGQYFEKYHIETLKPLQFFSAVF